jgi:hypothetical protein
MSRASRSVLLYLVASADAAVLATFNFSGTVPYTALDFFSLTFAVPPGAVEVQVDHALGPADDGSTNILDWGLADPARIVGWGGGNDEAALVGVAASSRSYGSYYGAVQALPAGNWSVVVGKPRISRPPGSLSVNVTVRDTATLPPQPERTPYVPCAPLETPPSLTMYAGDFHVHCRESGDAFASATLDEVATFARDVAGLDFVHISDHNTMSASDFMADAQPRHPRLLILPGVEYTTYHGHAGAILTTKFVDHRIGLPGVTIAGAAAAVHAQGGLFSINHRDLYMPDADGDLRNDCVGCAWDFGGVLPWDAIDAMEVGIQSWSGTGWLFSPRAIEAWDHAHALGFTHVAPIGGSDDHHGGQNETVVGPWREGSAIGSPTTCVLAANLSHAGIYEGVKAGRTAVKMGNASDPYLDVIATGPDGVAVRLGGVVASPSSGTVLLSITVTAVLASPHPAVLQLVRNNEVTLSAPVQWPASGVFLFNASVPFPLAGTDRWRAELHKPLPPSSGGSFSATPRLRGADAAPAGDIVALTNHIFLSAGPSMNR